MRAGGIGFDDAKSAEGEVAASWSSSFKRRAFAGEKVAANRPDLINSRTLSDFHRFQVVHSQGDGAGWNFQTPLALISRVSRTLRPSLPSDASCAIASPSQKRARPAAATLRRTNRR